LIDFGYAAYRTRMDANAAQRPEIKEFGDRLVDIAVATAKAVPVEWSARPTIS